MSGSYNLLVSSSITVPSRSGNSWNVAASVFDGSNSFPYSKQYFTTGQGLHINRHGNLLYSATSLDTITTYVMPAPRDISNLQYLTSSSIYKPYSSGSPTSILVSTSGNSAIVSMSDNSLFQYNMSNSWDLSSSTLVPGSNYLAVRCTSFFISDDGLKLFVLYNRTITRYSLGSPYDIATATVISSVTIPYYTSSILSDLYIKPDGSTVYLLDKGTKIVYEYPIYPEWDITQMNYFSGSGFTFLNVSSQEQLPSSVEFNPDGTGMYITGDQKDSIYYYRIFIPWDKTSAVSQGNVLNLQDSTLYPSDFYISPDGYNLLTVHAGNQKLLKFTATTAWDFTTVPRSVFPIPSQISATYASTLAKSSTRISFNSDGTKVILATSGVLVSCTLSSAWDLSNLSSPTRGDGIVLMGHSMSSMSVDYSYTKMYIGGLYKIYEYPLSGNFSISSIPQVNYSNIGFSSTNPSVTLSNNNVDLYASDGTYGTTISRYKMGTPLSINSVSLINSVSGMGIFKGAAYINVSDVNTDLLVFSSDDSLLFKYDLVANPANTSISINARSNGQFLLETYLSTDKYPIGLQFKPDGSGFFVLSTGSGLLNEYSLSTPWDISTAYRARGTYVGYSYYNARKFFISREGSNIYTMDGMGSIFPSRISRDVLGAPWQAYSASAGYSYYNASMPYYENIVLSTNGSRYYVSNSDAVVEYTMSTAWNVATGIKTHTMYGSFSSNMYIPPTGNAIYLAVNNTVVKVPLANNWDLSSNSYSRTVLTQSQTSNVGGMAISSDGNNLYLLDRDRMTLLSYSIG